MKSLLLIFGSGIAMCFFSACKKKTSEPGPTVAKEKIIEIKTPYGTMYMWLYKETPQHRANFLKLAGEGFFDSSTFHRVVSNFVSQGGDPNSKDADSTNDGFGGPGYTVPAEILSTLKHDYGAVGAARDNNPAKASNGSQFYIVNNSAGYPSLNNNYTVFGKVFSGIQAAVDMAKVAKNANNRPYKAIKMDVNVVEKTLEELKTEFGFVP
ncbi:MAG: peptidylprolyl isomerase [Bacteroidetes bacterium]|nr:peptidylprolyl isomerase [Bacteroidota bacterium]